MNSAAAIRNPGTRNRIWFLVILISGLFHLAAVFGLRNLNLFTPPPRPAPSEDILEFVFSPSEPTRFTELPADRAEAPAENPELLSNVDSRARDALPGGALRSSPHSEGLADFPQVAMAPAGAPPEASREFAEVPDRSHPLAARPAFEAAEPVREAAEAGAEDIYQEAAHAPEANAALGGDISLSTTAWVYGHWMQRFRRAVQANWYPPYAFKIGMLHGWTRVELEVAPSGELLRLQVLDDEGHTSLRESSLAALRAAAPFDALPADFPDETLVVQVKMNYLNEAVARARRAGR